MVNFRFHLVSLIAVFLSLALGIGMGATVIDKATVDLLQDRLDTVRNEARAANQRSDQLQTQLSRSDQYESSAGEYVVDGRLRNTPVVIFAMRGSEEGPLNDLRSALTKAGANVQGTLWFRDKARLEDASVLESLRSALGLPGAPVDQLRTAMLARASGVVAGATEPAGLQPLIDAQVVEWTGAASGEVGRADFAGSRLVLYSGAGADVPNEQLAQPLARSLASQPNRRLLAVESGREPDARTSGERAIFVGPLRSDAAIDGRISTVDHLEESAGRVASVLALSQLPGRTGDYGVGPGADQIIPPINP